MRENGLQGFQPYSKAIRSKAWRNYESNRFLPENKDLSSRSTLPFTSERMKRQAIKSSRDNNWDMIDQPDREKKIKERPVLKELGIIWKQYVNAFCDEQEAYEKRWRIRCAINVFNEMNSGIQIKFGNNGKDGGSMNLIRYVVVDGEKIPVKRWIANAEFENTLLKAE
jgi:hypothetical protein